jgi:molecular chaperone GrpE (heat shock protein)
LGLAITAPFRSRASANKPKLTTNKSNTNNVVAFRHAPRFQRQRVIARTEKVRELEDENARLRNSVIQLALEIQNLRERRSCPRL